MKIIGNVYVTCPMCGARLIVYEETYYNMFEGDIIKDVQIEWECPNDCCLNDDQIYAIDEHIENVIYASRKVICRSNA